MAAKFAKTERMKEQVFRRVGCVVCNSARLMIDVAEEVGTGEPAKAHWGSLCRALSLAKAEHIDLFHPPSHLWINPQI